MESVEKAHEELYAQREALARTFRSLPEESVQRLLAPFDAALVALLLELQVQLTARKPLS